MCGALAGGGKIAAFFVKVAENHLSDDSELLELHFHNKCFEHLNPAKRNRRATGEGCRQRVSHYRTRFSKAWAFWCRSGQGDGENITEADLREKTDKLFQIASSEFWDFCSHDVALYYFYLCCVKYGLVQSSLRELDEVHKHNGESKPSLFGRQPQVVNKGPTQPEPKATRARTPKTPSPAVNSPPAVVTPRVVQHTKVLSTPERATVLAKSQIAQAEAAHAARQEEDRLIDQADAKERELKAIPKDQRNGIRFRALSAQLARLKASLEEKLGPLFTPEKQPE